jgi:hypothetical protein
MVSKMEMQNCLEAMTTKIIDMKPNAIPNDQQANEMIRMGSFMLLGFLECLFDIRDSLQTIAQTPYKPSIKPINPFEPTNDGSTKG